MGKLKSVDELFEGRHFDREIIGWARSNAMARSLVEPSSCWSASDSTYGQSCSRTFSAACDRMRKNGPQAVSPKCARRRSALRPSEAVQRAVARGRLLEHRGTARLTLQCVPHRLHLAANVIKSLQ
jgi:hypothetical protein